MSPATKASNISYWERSTYLAPQDFVVVGAGIVGLSTALFLRQYAPTAKITVVERGILPTGASSKNAGFACFGSLSEILRDEEIEGTESMLALVKQRYDGLQLLLKNVDAKDIDYAQCGNFEIFTDAQRSLHEKCASNVARINGLLRSAIGLGDVFSRTLASQASAILFSIEAKGGFTVAS
jgi:gamma-glutamylputrescine oxidase